LIRGNSFTGYSVDPTDRTYGTKYNLILGCQTGITNMYLWVNPSSSTLDYSTTNATWTTTDVGNSSNWRFGSYSIQNTFSAGPGGGVIPGVGIYKVCITTNYSDAYNDLAGAPPSDPFTTWQNFYFTPAELANPNFSGPNADPLGKGINNTNQFLAGFSPTNSAAYPHVISIVRTDGTNITVTYLGASGDNSYTGGPASRTNVLEVSAGTANGSYSNNYVSTGITNILSGGSGLGQVATMVHTNGASSSTQYYRVRVLVP
jgi:hypothetical protein